MFPPLLVLTENLDRGGWSLKWHLTGRRSTSRSNLTIAISTADSSSATDVLLSRLRELARIS